MPALIVQHETHTHISAFVSRAGDDTSKRFIEFFTAHIRNQNTRRAYGRAVAAFFAWCDGRGLELRQIDPVTVAAYIEQHTAAKPTVKLQLAAIRSLFDWLVTGGVIPFNPASSVRGPKYVLKKGLTQVLTAKEARRLLNSIETDTVIGLRDRALIGVMAFSFARISAAVGMRVEDYFTVGRERWLRLHEKGGKLHEVPAHPKSVRYLDAYLKAAGIREDKNGSIFRTFGRDRVISERQMAQIDAWKMIKRRAQAAKLPSTTCNHTFRATGITAYLENGGTIEGAQAIAAHESPRTTKLYDRRGDRTMRNDILKIAI